jgi:predicted MFS family arabinose efflux permease
VFEVLRGPFSARLFASSLVAQTPASTLGLVFVLRTRELTGSFAAAGAASGAAALASAVLSPAFGRAIDRRGQVGVLVATALASAAGLVAFALLPHGAALGAILVCAVVGGGMLPPLGAALRTVWPTVLPAEQVHAAFALEAAFLESTYIVGPVLIAGAIGAWSTAAAALTCAAVLLAGTAVFAAAAPVRAWRPAGVRAGRMGALRSGGVRTLIAIYALIGATFGAVEVGVPAATSAAGHAHLAGLLLGIWAVGSFCGGLLAARAPAPADRVRRLCLLLVLLAVGHALLALPASVTVLAALLLVAGSVIAPSFGIAFAMVGDVAAPGTLAEAYSWLTTGIAAGLAVGSSAGGALAQAHGAGGAFLVAAGAGASAAAFGALRRRSLVHAPAPA